MPNFWDAIAAQVGKNLDDQYLTAVAAAKGDDDARQRLAERHAALVASTLPVKLPPEKEYAEVVKKLQEMSGSSMGMVGKDWEVLFKKYQELKKLLGK